MSRLLPRAAFALSLLAPACVGAVTCPSPGYRSEAFMDRWTALDAARRWRTQDDGKRRDHHELLTQYPAHAAELRALEDDFSAFLDDPVVGCEASAGLRETLTEIMIGQLVMGNEPLIEALRTRYPVPTTMTEPTGGCEKLGTGTTVYCPNSGDPIALLVASALRFEEGIRAVAPRLRQAPTSLRTRGAADSATPIFVENTPPAGASRGELVENEIAQLTQLALRWALATTQQGRKYYYDGTAVPTQGVDRVKLAHASDTLRRAGHNTYLQSVVLAAVQRPDDFRANRGTQLRGAMRDAQAVFDDLHKGVNPLRQRTDNVEDLSIPSLVQAAHATWNDARQKEALATRLTRQYDIDSSDLRDALLEQRVQYMKEIYGLIGLVPLPGDLDPTDLGSEWTDVEGWFGTKNRKYDIRTEEGAEQVLLVAWDKQSGNDEEGIADDYIATCTFELCQARADWEAAKLDVEVVQAQIKEIYAQIQAEEDRINEISRIRDETAVVVRGLDIATAVAAVIPDFELGLGGSGAIPISINNTVWKPADVIEKALNVGRNLVEYLQEKGIDAADSSATIQNLLSQLLTLNAEMNAAQKARTIARNRYTGRVADLDWLLSELRLAQEVLADQYFANPAYRIRLDKVSLEADARLQDAMVDAYRLAKRLEYEWAEPFTNPPNRVNGDTSIVNFGTIATPEAAFAVASSGTPASSEPTLYQFLETLSRWDFALRSDMRDGRQSLAQAQRVSFKRQILGITGDDAFASAVFRRYVSEHVTPAGDLVIEFGLPIRDPAIIPTRYQNLRIETLAVEMQALPDHSLFSGGTRPPFVELRLGGQSEVRTFHASPPEHDDVLVRDLDPPKENSGSTLRALLDASADGRPGSVNTQLRNKSPCATRWRLRIEKAQADNKYLRFENLDDITLVFGIVHGVPEDTWQPALVPVPDPIIGQ